MSKREEREARADLWVTRVGWTVVITAALSMLFFLFGIWSGDDRLSATGGVFLAPAIIGALVWGIYKMESSF